MENKETVAFFFRKLFGKFFINVFFLSELQSTSVMHCRQWTSNHLRKKGRRRGGEGRGEGEKCESGEKGREPPSPIRLPFSLPPHPLLTPAMQATF